MALFVAGIPSDVAVAQGASPKSMNITQNTLSADALDSDMDAAGKYAVVAVAPLQVDPQELPQLYVFDMKLGQRVHTARYPSSITSLSADITRAAVAMEPDANAGSHFAVAVRNQALLYDLNADTPSRQHAVNSVSGTDAKVMDVALSSTSSRLALGISYTADQAPDDLTKTVLGNVTVFDTNLGSGGTMKRLWSHTYPSPVTAVAVGGNILAVATESYIFVYSNLDVANNGATYSGTAQCTSSTACQFRDMREGIVGTENAVRHLAFSNNGQFLVAGTDRGEILLLNTANIASPRMSQGLSGGALRGVAINSLGTLFAGVWNDGTLRVYSHDAASTTVHTQMLYDTAPVGGTPKALSMSSSGEFIVVTTSATAYAFTSDRETVQWTIDTVDQETLLKAQLTPDGKRVAVTRSKSFQGYEQLTRVAIIPDRYVDPNTQTEVPNVGQLVAPGGQVTYGFTIRNDGTTDDRYSFSMLKPLTNDWQVFMPEDVDLAPGEDERVTLDLIAPAAVPAGSYDFTVGVASERLGQNAGSITFYANVTKLSRVVLVPGPGQARNVSVSSDQPTPFTLHLQNLGNAEAIVNLSITDQVPSGSSTVWNVTLDQERNIRVAGGETIVIEGTILPPQSAQDGDRTVLNIQPFVNETARGNPLELTFILNPRYGVSLTAEQGHEIIPGGTRTPIEITVRNTGNTRETIQFCFNVTAPTGVTGSDRACQVLTTDHWKVDATNTKVEISRGGDTRSYTLFVQPRVQYPEIETITIEAVVIETLATNDVKSDTLAIGVERAPEDVVDDEPFWKFLPGPATALTTALAALAAIGLQRRERPPRAR